MRDVTMILITVAGGERPFRVLALTAEQAAAAPGSMMRAKVRDAVQCRDLPGARSYANGMAHGASLVGGRHLPVMLDSILAEADEARAERFASVNLIREA